MDFNGVRMVVYKVKEILKDEAVGLEVTLRGWVYRHRVVGKKVFIVLRDSTNIVQCVIDGALLPKIYSLAEKLGLETSIEVRGRVKKEPRAPTGYEVEVVELKVSGVSSDFPIKGGEGVDYLLDNRHLWLRSRYLTEVMKIKSTVLKAAREWLTNNGWWETTPPILTASACEGGATLFEVKYFDRKAYLSQSAQLYLEALIYSLEKVWSLTPSFRAELSRTRRHLTEYWHLELEAAWYTMDDVMKVSEELVSYIVKRVLEENADQLQFLKRDTRILENSTKTPYPRIRYDEAIEMLQRRGFKIRWGDDFGADEERVLTEYFDKPFFITHFPKKVKSFYMKLDEENPEIALGFDLLAPEGYGEIIGGSQREDDYQKLLNRIIEEGYSIDEYKWYLDLRKYGSVPHSGFGLGIERLVMWIAGLEHIRDAIPFPRMPGKIYP